MDKQSRIKELQVQIAALQLEYEYADALQYCMKIKLNSFL